MKRGFRRIISLFDRDKERELDAEIQFHIDATMRELMEQGFPEARARQMALERFGDFKGYRVRLRRASRQHALIEHLRAPWERLAVELSLIARSFRREPIFVAAVVITLGLGVGINATMFSIVDRLLFQPPIGVENPDEVFRATGEIDFANNRRVEIQTFSYPDVEDLSDVPGVATAGGYWVVDLLHRGSNATQPVTAAIVTEGFLALTGVAPALGRIPLPDEDGWVVLGHGFWTREYGRDSAVVGTDIRVGSQVYTIVGVAQRGFSGFDQRVKDMWLPARTAGSEVVVGFENERGSFWLWPFIRLEPGYNVETVARAASQLIEQRRQSVDQALGLSLRFGALVPDNAVGGRDQKKLASVLGLLSFVVLAVSVLNVSNLMMGRNVRRRREVALRLALGITRKRLLSSIVGESVLLMAVGFGVAMIFAWSTEFLRDALVPSLEWEGTASGTRQIVYAALTAVAVALVMSIGPWLQTREFRLTEALGSQRSTSIKKRTREAIVVAQIALSLLLVFGAGLFVRSLREASNSIVGFEPDGLYVATMDFGGLDIETEEERRYYEAAFREINDIPGVESASHSMTHPFGPSWGWRFSVPGRNSIPRPPDGGPYAFFVDASYFDVVGQEVVKGRPIDDRDGVGTPPVIVVNEALARRVWPGEDPLGKCAVISSDGPCAEVVGVAADTPRQILLGEQEVSSMFFAPISQRPALWGSRILLRSDQPESELVSAVRERLSSIVPGGTWIQVRSLNDMIAPRLRQWRLGARVLTFFGMLAVAVAFVGVYSVIALGVSERRREFAIRKAVGATGAAIMGGVVRRTASTAALGIGLGLLASVAGGQLARSMLFGVSPTDPRAVAAAISILAASALAAALAPAARAARVECAEILRKED